MPTIQRLYKVFFAAWNAEAIWSKLFPWKHFLTLFEVFVFHREAAVTKVLINGDTGWQYAPPNPWGGFQIKKKKRVSSDEWCQCYIQYEIILELSSILTLTFKLTRAWNPSFVNNYSNRCFAFDVQSVVFLINNFTADQSVSAEACSHNEHLTGWLHEYQPFMWKIFLLFYCSEKNCAPSGHSRNLFEFSDLKIQLWMGDIRITRIIGGELLRVDFIIYFTF